jgi:hypothetical protein
MRERAPRKRKVATSGTPTRGNEARPTKMVTITMPPQDLEALDLSAAERGESRSGYILEAVRSRIARG